MELDSKPVQVADVQGAKVVVERVVQKGVVDGEVAGRVFVGDQRRRSSAVGISRRSFPGRFGAGQRRVWIRGADVGAEIQSVCESSRIVSARREKSAIIRRRTGTRSFQCG